MARWARVAVATFCHFQRRVRDCCGGCAVAVVDCQRFTLVARRYAAQTAQARDDPATFWLPFARQAVQWDVPPSTALQAADDVAPGWVDWFPDGRMNMSVNCLDRHVEAGLGDRVAVAYESAVGGTSRNVTYAELLHDVSKLAGALADLGVRAGDTCVVYMPMIPEAVVAMLACTRIGAVHVVVFGGFAVGVLRLRLRLRSPRFSRPTHPQAPELAARIRDTQPAAIITADCGVERGNVLPYVPIVQEALTLDVGCDPHIIVAARDEFDTPPAAGDATPVLDFRQLLDAAVPAAPVSRAANDALYVLHTSGTTAAPKGIVRDLTHAVGLLWSMEHYMRCHRDAGGVYWAASDIGWVVGHSFTVYAPLLSGCTTVLYEGKPVEPDAGQLWRVAAKHGVTHMFTAPTALRAVRKMDPELHLVDDHDLSALQTLFVAGERCDELTINAFAAALRKPVVDNFWQTETGWPICGFTLDDVGCKPGSAGLPLPGWRVKSILPSGDDAAPGQLGALAVQLPLPPGIMSRLFGGAEALQRMRASYLEPVPGHYFVGDEGHVDEDGYVSILSRNDDVINVAAHRLSTSLVESAVVHASPAVAECACFGAADALKGQVPCVLIVLKDDVHGAGPEEVKNAVVAGVRATVGAVASLKPEQIGFVAALPKTRSGKILRRILQSVADSKSYTVPSTIEDAATIDLAIAALHGLGYPRQ